MIIFDLFHKIYHIILEIITFEKSISYQVDFVQNSFSKNLKAFQLPLHKSTKFFQDNLYFHNHFFITLKSEGKVHT